MSDYKHVNLKDVDDSAAERGPRTSRRGSAASASSQTISASATSGIGPGFRSPYGHRHREQEEAYVIVSGSGRMRLDDEVVDLAQWDVVRVAPERRACV